MGEQRFDGGRRRVLAFAAGAALSMGWPRTRAQAQNGIRIGLTPVFLDDQLAFLNEWRAYLAAQFGQPVTFVQKGSYREIAEMLRQDALDFAWLCGYPYVRYRRQMRLLAVPLFNGKPLYQSYVIVPATDTRTRSLADLRGKVFAYSDPDSNSGYLYPRFALVQAREDPSRFFARTFFTWGHRKVVQAVASGLAQGGAVDGYVWETLRLLHPDLTGRTRIVQRSPDFGFPPFVARSSLSGSEFTGMQRVLLDMSGRPDGVAVLKRLNLDGFVPGEPSLFDGIARMMRALDESHVAPA